MSTAIYATPSLFYTNCHSFQRSFYCMYFYKSILNKKSMLLCFNDENALKVSTSLLFRSFFIHLSEHKKQTPNYVTTKTTKSRS